MDETNIKRIIPGQWWGTAFMTLPDPQKSGPASVALDVPQMGVVRFTCEPWSYNVHGGRNWAWQLKRAVAAGERPTFVCKPRATSTWT